MEPVSAFVWPCCFRREELPFTLAAGAGLLSPALDAELEEQQAAWASRDLRGWAWP